MTPIQNPPRTRNIRPGGHIELFFALLLFALQPVFIQGQSPTPTPASVDASLFQAQSIKPALPLFGESRSVSTMIGARSTQVF